MTRQDYCKSRIAPFAMMVAVVFSFAPSFASAEEIIIEEGSSLAGVACGDYFCSPCLAKISADSFLMEGGSQSGIIELTAGELWQFFKAQGHDSVSKMTLFLDVDQLSEGDEFNLSKLSIQIQNPLGGDYLTDTNLGADHLIVPGYETSSSRPEAELRFDLGYDFMQRFSSESTEIVRVSMESPLSSMSPTFHLVADDNVFGQTNLGQMFLFVLFWGAVFLMLLRWMKPVRSSLPARATLLGQPKRQLTPN